MLVEAMSKPSDTPGFRQLLKDWNKKLSDSGFKDIEESRVSGPKLKKTGTEGRFEKEPSYVREARAKYYDIIGEKIIETQFDDEREKQILCFYFEGYSKEQIRNTFSPPLHRTTVYKKIEKWLRAWGMK